MAPRTSCAAGPASTGIARPWTRPACRSIRRLIRYGNFHVQEGTTEGRALLALADPPTAIFAGNDLQALGVYQAAREARLHIPEDLSVVGFDDLPVAAGSVRRSRPSASRCPDGDGRPRVSSCGWPTASSRSQTRVELATELIVRESTAPPAR